MRAGVEASARADFATALRCASAALSLCPTLTNAWANRSAIWW